MMSTNGTKKLFTPTQIGPTTLKHRIVMAPMTRQRSHWPSNVPSDLQVEYYTQRSSEGGLIIAEGTAVSHRGHGGKGSPGLWTADQVSGWQRVTDAVHAKGSFMFAQLWHAGRLSHVSTSGETPVAPSVDPEFWINPASPANLVSTPDGLVPPSPHRALEVAEIPGVVDEYRIAAHNAKTAGFDGVELHSAYGYLLDEFLQDISNHRTDGYGGSIENRVRLLTEVVEATISVWGADRVAVRIAPSNTFHAMGDSNPHALFNHVAARLNEYGLAYLHVIEPRVRGFELIGEGQGPIAAQELRKLFDGPIIATGGFEPATAEGAIVRGDADLIGFARWFISNPDLPQRIALGVPLNDYDRNTFYTFDAHGYTDYPVYDIAAQQHV
jgi:N-ethylmaleimide reductase